MVADSVEFLRARAWTCCSTPSTSSTATSATPSSRCACSKPRRRRVRRTSCCATPTAARCRTRSSGSSREVVTYLGGDVRVAVHLHDDGGTGVANAIAGVLGGATQVQGTINGYGERTGNCNLTAIIPNLSLKMGIETIPRRSHGAAHAGRAPRRRAREHAAQPAGGVRRALGVRAQGRAAHERDRQAARRVRAPVARRRRQRHALRRVGARGQVDARAEGQGARPRARRPAARRGRRAAEAARARGLPLRGRRRLARAADAPRDRLGARLVRGRVVPRDHRRPHRRRDADRRDRRDRHDRGDGEGARAAGSA